MAKFTPSQIDIDRINGGNRYQDGDYPTPDTFNAPIEAAAYAQQLALGHSQQISYLQEQSSKYSDKISRNTKAIENLESQLSSDLIIESRQFAYTVPVPIRSAPYAKITKFGGMSYVVEGTLRHAKPTAFKSVGVNLFDIGKVTYSKNCGGDTGIPYRAVSAIIPHKYPMYIKVNNLPSNIHYEINYHSANEYSYGAFVSASGWIEDTEVHTTQNYGNANYIIILFGAIDNASTITKEDIEAMQLQVSYNEFSSYTPYREPITLAIPTAVLDKFDGYGKGRVYNFIDWSAKEYHKVYGAVDLGTLDWTLSDTFYATVSDKEAGISNILCAKYENADTPFSQMQDKSVTGNEIYPLIYIKDSAYTDAATFKSAMQGVMLIYELATPEVTDISDILPDDNLIAVEGGGTIIAENEYGYAVPSEIVYQLMGAGGTGGSSLPQYLGEYEVIE